MTIVSPVPSPASTDPPVPTNPAESTRSLPPPMVMAFVVAPKLTVSSPAPPVKVTAVPRAVVNLTPPVLVDVIDVATVNVSPPDVKTLSPAKVTVVALAADKAVNVESLPEAVTFNVVASASAIVPAVILLTVKFRVRVPAAAVTVAPTALSATVKFDNTSLVITAAVVMFLVTEAVVSVSTVPESVIVLAAPPIVETDVTLDFVVTAIAPPVPASTVRVFKSAYLPAVDTSSVKPPPVDTIETVSMLLMLTPDANAVPLK